MDDITHLLFNNFYFTEYIEYIEKKLNDKEILDEIYTKYPNFSKDFKSTLDDLYGELNELTLLVKKLCTNIHFCLQYLQKIL